MLMLKEIREKMINMIKKQMKNTIFLKFCRKNQHQFQISEFGGCKALEIL